MYKEPIMKKIAKAIIPPLITMVTAGVILAIQGIYPFGTHTVDYYDMAQQIAAFYYHVYDMLHGTKAFFYDFYTALGVNMAMSTSGCSNLSLFNLFFLFIKREMLLESLSFFLVLKMMCMTCSMQLFLHKEIKAPYPVETILSVGYGFCGFVLVLYITNQWMDLAILFPLLIMAAKRLLCERKSHWYVILLSLALINSYYISFMMLIFIFLFTGLILLYQKWTGVQYYAKGAVARLGIFTLAACGISSFIVLPQLLQTFSSKRFQVENEGGLLTRYLEIIAQVKGAYTTRWWSLLGVSFGAALIMAGVLKYRKEKKQIAFVVSAVLLVILELFFESINLIWHFGSYVQYPIRNGFMIYFVIATLGAYYSTRLYQEERIKLIWGHCIIGIAFTALISYFLIRGYLLHVPKTLRATFHLTVIVVAVSGCLYMLLILIKKKWALMYCGAVFLCEMILFGFLLIGKPIFTTGYSEEPEQEGEYIRICNQLMSELDLEEDPLVRIKNPDESLNANYGLVLKRSSLSNWTHLIAPFEQSSAVAWGYSSQFTRLLDAGGTVFSDALLGIRHVLTYQELPKELYRKSDETVVTVDSERNTKKTYHYYEAAFELPVGLLVDSDCEVEWDHQDYVALNNAMYEAISGEQTQKQLMQYLKQGTQHVDDKIEDYKQYQTEGIRHESFTIHVTGRKVLYFSGSEADCEYKNNQIYVNDQIVLIPSIKDDRNTYYPAHFNNNVVCLGVYENEDVRVRILSDATKGPLIETLISELDLSLLERICENSQKYAAQNLSLKTGKSSIFVDVSCDAGKKLILPIVYDNGYKVKVNGKEAEPREFAGLFTQIDLEALENTVEITYLPEGMKLGAVCTCMTLALLVICFILLKKNSVAEEAVQRFEEKSDLLFTRLYIILWYAVILAMYVIPMAGGIIYTVIHKIG